MNPRIAANQHRYLAEFIARIQPHVRTDSALPQRIKQLLGANRALGSRDRRLYRELLYTAVRYWPWIESSLARSLEEAATLAVWLTPDELSSRHLREVVLGSWPKTPGPAESKAATLSQFLGRSFRAHDLLPSWLHQELPAAFSAPLLDCLLARVPLWVRMQVEDRTMVIDEFRRRGWSPESPVQFPDALKLAVNAEVASSDVYRRGFVEIQDLGSQLVLQHAPVLAGERWLDACAGAGGKTLQLARMIGPEGVVEARDVRPAILSVLKERVSRARLDNVRIPAEAGADYDGVLVDAPCSGSGTWRRQPHLKWQVSGAMVDEFASQQEKILAENAARVGNGGVLVYATCSLSGRENRRVVERFLATHPDFRAESPVRDWGAPFDGLGTAILPNLHDNDGFYVAVLRRQ